MKTKIKSERDNPEGYDSNAHIGPPPLTFLVAVVLALTVPARAETPPAAIPFPDIGAKATAEYQGDALGITATSYGARLRCGFQKLEGRATPEGLWLESTDPGGAGKLRLVAKTLGREENLASSAQGSCAEGTSENSPAFQRWDRGGQSPSREATAEVAPRFGRPCGTSSVMRPNPALKRWASVESPSGTDLPRTGTVSVADKLVRFTRPGVTEEYSVTADGVRQDFVIAAPPAGAGDLRVELALNGARAEAAACGARFRLEGSGRALAYSHLRVEDATGRELTARLEVVSADRLAVSVADANATYPVRIDPTFSDADWISLGSGMNGDVYALAVSGTNLYAGGDFTTAGGVPANRIAKWDGSAWSALGSGMNNRVRALAVNGTNLYAGGVFTTAGGVPANYIAKWDGSAWSTLGLGMDAEVWALAVAGTEVYAGGYFTNAGGVLANYIAKWNGTVWSALGSGMVPVMGGYARVAALAVSGTNLYAAGQFETAGGVTAKGIAKWDGSAWSALGSAVTGGQYALAVSGTDLYMAGQLVEGNSVAKWNGSAWSSLRPGPAGFLSVVVALAVSGADLYAGGSFWYFDANGGSYEATNHIAKWDGSVWSNLGSGINRHVYALAADGVGHLFVGGDFSGAGTNLSPYIAQANLGSAPTVSMPPQAQTAEAGATVQISVDAVGKPPPVYQWYFNGTNLLSCANSDLVLTNILFSQSGTYTVVVTNQFGAVTSAPAMLGVIPAVERRPVAGVKLMGDAGSLLNVDYADSLSATPNWLPLHTVTLASTSQYYFDVSEPLSPQRYYKAWQTGAPVVMPTLDLHMIPAITLTSSVGNSVRVEGINAVGPIDAWFPLDTVTLTNTSQLYFDVSAPGQPQRLYRLVPVP